MKRKNIKRILLAVLLIMLVMLVGAKSVYAGGESVVDDVIDGIVGILLYPLRLIPILIGAICQMIANAIADKGLGFVALDQILFTASGWEGNVNKNLVSVASVDFFGLSDDTYWGGSGGIFVTIRNSVASWYVGVRNLAAIALIIIAVYVGIRMAIATVAEEQAKYKNLLYDWLKSIGLLFAMHFVMLFIIYINDALVRAIGASLTDNGIGTDDSLKGVFDDYLIESLATISFTVGTAKALIYAGLSLLTLTYLITYIKRMITIAFLIIISPLVTVTYSIDKMGDNKSQALNEWFKEFTYNILIQPFHCIIYRSLVVVAIDILNNHDYSDLSKDGDASIAAGVIAIMIIAFMSTAEKMVKHIFHFHAKHMADPVAEAAIVGSVLSKTTSGGSNKNKYADDGEDKSGGGNGGGGTPPPPQTTGTQSGVNANGKDRRRSTNQAQVANQARDRSRSKIGKKVDKTTGQDVDKKSTKVKNYIKNNASTPSKVIAGAYGSMLKKGLKATTVLTAGSMAYMATGNFGKAIVAGSAANNVQKKALVRAEEQKVTQSQRELAKAYHDFQDYEAKNNNAYDDDAVRIRINELMALDDAEAEDRFNKGQLSHEEINLRNKAIKLRNSYRNDAGIRDSAKLDRAMLKSLYGIQSGDIGEYSNTERYYVQAKNWKKGGPKIK